MSHVDEEKNHGSLSVRSPVQNIILPTVFSTEKPMKYWLFHVMHILEQSCRSAALHHTVINIVLKYDS